LALLSITAQPRAAAVVVEFGSDIVNAKVRFIIDKPEGEAINDTDLVGVGFTSLEIVGFGVDNLFGLEYCLDLISIDFSDNFISDISPLASLEQLETVILERNQISALTPLSGLPNLTTLNAAENLVADLSPLSGLTTLRVLTLDNNAIEAIALLEGLSGLREVGLADNLIQDAGPSCRIPASVSSTPSTFSKIPCRSYPYASPSPPWRSEESSSFPMGFAPA
jgi:hypothetical protein